MTCREMRRDWVRNREAERNGLRQAAGTAPRVPNERWRFFGRVATACRNTVQPFATPPVSA
jgi:hypothetical protein